LGFDYKWKLGWMQDTLEYLAADTASRPQSHHHLTFPIWYAFDERFLLPLSHDEVVHLKQALITKMPGDDWQRFATVRALFGYMFSRLAGAGRRRALYHRLPAARSRARAGDCRRRQLPARNPCRLRIAGARSRGLARSAQHGRRCVRRQRRAQPQSAVG
jgi:hypothetical protein